MHISKTTFTEGWCYNHIYSLPHAHGVSTSRTQCQYLILHFVDLALYLGNFCAAGVNRGLHIQHVRLQERNKKSQLLIIANLIHIQFFLPFQLVHIFITSQPHASHMVDSCFEY